MRLVQVISLYGLKVLGCKKEKRKQVFYLLRYLIFIIKYIVCITVTWSLLLDANQRYVYITLYSNSLYNVSNGLIIFITIKRHTS